MLVALCFETGHQVLDLAVASFAVERHEEIRRTEVAVILGYFKFEDEVIAPGVPGQLVDNAVILMQIFARVSEDQIGRELAFQFFEEFLDFGSLDREEAVAKTQNSHAFPRGALEEELGAATSLTLAFGSGAENDPVKLQIAARPQKL